MSIKDFFKKTLIGTAICYTAVTSLFSLIIMILYSGVENGAGLDAVRIFLFLPFSFLFGIANTLLCRERPDPIIRWFLHFLLTVTGAFTCILLPSGVTGSGRFTGLLLIIVIYAVSAVIIGITCSRLKKAMKKDRELRSDPSGKKRN
ncbi:MAG: hypothetical protein MJ102_00470 [Clostridia bacterium]|nr:hypothetical protein [Clostridia bacterium]